ncbi:MAG: sulfotransferase [Deltaproteobacteria bacterium]|nr:sulfotransferase [Deltaproteobacteria bacterium]MBW2418468.1 sulfotransferase [Deltaproteobacteria bacterium]
MSWTPPKRPVWADRLIAHGEAVGGAQHLVSLAADELLAEATRSTGLSDFGGDAWRPHFDLLLRSLEEEAGLHLLGRTLVRTEILQALRNRLRLAELWSARPAILEARIESPVFIVGSPRSGTSILHELMACDPASRAPAMWEMAHPLGGAECAELADRVTQFWHDLQPEYETMHANSGHLPNECIFITLHEFLSDHWGGCHVVPAYDAHLAATDQRPAYRFHKRFLQTLQARGESPRDERWLLKAPSHLSQLRTLFDIYPDARIVRTHRDPLKTLPSTISLMGTLKWMRCREVDMSTASKLMPAGYAYLYQNEIEARAAGTLPDERFVDVHFADLVRDPGGTVEGVYAKLGWPFPQSVRDDIADYAAHKPKGSRGTHRYSLEEVGIDAGEERERFRFYMERYGVAEEAP